MRVSLTIAAFAAFASTAMSQNCLSLAGSTTCGAFGNASISLNSNLVGLFPFLQYVTTRQQFDDQMNTYISQGYVRTKYRDIMGCQPDLSNTTDYYARYTTSYICNSIIQNSVGPCGLTDLAARPLCADSCAGFATSEQQIVSSNQLCPTRNSNFVDQLRADYTNCGLPPNSINGSQCITGASNEPNMCGFANNLNGLCNYCRGSTINDTDSCCFTSNATNRCTGVNLLVFSSVSGLFTTATPSATSTPNAPPNAGNNDNSGRLSGGAIAGIVVGSVVGFLLLLALIIFFCIRYRRRRDDSTSGSILNQPSPQRKGGDVSAMTYNPPASAHGYEVLPGGRVARMSAMQSEEAPQVGPRYGSGVDPYGDSPGPQGKLAGVMGAMGSPGNNDSSPDSNDFSSPEGVASGQSEQLPFFKDYYSNDDIHPNDKVSVLWAYQPRAGDEFELERGDMLKVVGIWDDGWATGVRIDERAEDYDGKHKAQRDSGVSNGSTARDESPIGGEIKAFPLVCVCLPEAWKKTVEGDSSTESGSGGIPT